jgi:putative phosphoesterase
MKIGIVSDSHGKSASLRKAVQHLAASGADAILHCGDICNQNDISILSNPGLPSYLVAGNMDSSAAQRLQWHAHGLGVIFNADYLEITLDDQTLLAATHGHNQNLLTKLINSGKYRYVCHGHTHIPAISTADKTTIICPGSTAHPRGIPHPTAVLLDTGTTNTRLFDLSTTPPTDISA